VTSRRSSTPMTWKRVFKSKRFRERSLQDVFDAWPSTDATSFAGVPKLFQGSWRNDRRTLGTGTWTARPDVVWRTRRKAETVLIELKFSMAMKNEPLALGQVLYEAWLMAQSGQDQVVMALVTQHSPWLRGALDHLRSHRFPLKVLRCFEVEALGPPLDRLLWFDEPLQPWRRTTKAPPIELPIQAQRIAKCWFRVAETNTWIGVAGQLPRTGAKRPVRWKQDYVMVAQVSGRTDGWVCWWGKPDHLGNYRRSTTAPGL